MSLRFCETWGFAERILPTRSNLFRVSRNCSDQLDQPAHRPQQQPDHADPRLVQPPVQQSANQIPSHCPRRKHERKLAIAPKLHPGAFLAVRGWILAWHGIEIVLTGKFYAKSGWERLRPRRNIFRGSVIL